MRGRKLAVQQEAKTWLVTGGQGFLGKALLRKIPDHHKFIVFDKNVRNVSPTLMVSGDVANQASVRRALDRIKPNVVVHLAAITGVERCNTDPSLSFETNVLGTFNVALASADCEAHLIFASSREVYGDTRGEKSVETDLCHPNNFYGMTKLIGEQLIQSVSKLRELKYTILRFTNLYGPGGDQYVVASVAKKLLRGEPITIMGGEQILNMLYVDDAAEAILRASQNRGAIGEIINIGSADNTSAEQLIIRMMSEVRSKKPLFRKPMRQGDTVRFMADVSKAHRLLGFQAETTLKDGLKNTIDHYRRLLSA
jgi:nucleoside-diphosphate-sugar epimerase